MLEQIKFNAPNPDVIVWKWPDENIKLGAQVIVNQSQEAIFVKGGKALDVFGPGTHTLSTGNLPLLGRLINRMFGNKTPFTAEVWFVNKTVRRGLHWGTGIQVIEPEYNFPVNIGAFGDWGIRISDTSAFVSQIVGSRIGADVQLIDEWFKAEITQKASKAIADYISKEKLSVFNINTKLDEMSESVAKQITPEFDRFGIEIVQFNVNRMSLPESEQKKFQEVLGKKMEISQLGDAKVTSAYEKIKQLEILEKAAKNPSAGMGGMMGVGFGLGAGLPLGRQFADDVTKTPADDAMGRLQKLKQMLDAGLITADEFNAKKQEILSKI